MTALAAALAAAYGVFLLYTASAYGWKGLGPAPRRSPGVTGEKAKQWRERHGMAGAPVRDLAAAGAVLGVATGALTYAAFGGVLPPLAAGAFAATFPVTSWRARRERVRNEAREAWPQLIEEVRLRTTSLGRSVPQALFDVGRRAPQELRAAFAAGEREWLITTDFARTVALLKERFADATADATLETLLVAHEVGGGDIGSRLAALAEDRAADAQGRKDAIAKQAGVRFARRFVLIVPAGMALAGLSIGTGHQAYRTPGGQLAVMAGIAVIAACWRWAGRLMRLPEHDRVFP